MIDPKIKNLLQKQHYKIVGRHSAVKLCHWLKKSILDEGYCYKQRFYGISSHRCLQMTPAVIWCTHKCIFCWRNTDHTLGYELGDCDEPSDIIDEAIEKQRMLLSGYGGIPDRINKRKFREAQDPNQAAISLSGEPTIYPRISELIEEFKKRGFTTFLVSNGTFPERFMDMTLPTQLYISIDAPDKKTYKRVCNPITRGTWERINRSLELLPSLDTRKVIRITLIKGLNDINLEGYAELIRKAEPNFIEVKAFMLLGGARKRLSLENMPSFEYVEEFSRRLSAEVGYGVADTSVDSRVVLLSKTDKAYIPIPPKD